MPKVPRMPSDLAEGSSGKTRAKRRNHLARAKSDTDYLPGTLLVQMPLPLPR